MNIIFSDVYSAGPSNTLAVRTPAVGTGYTLDYQTATGALADAVISAGGLNPVIASAQDVYADVVFTGRVGYEFSIDAPLNVLGGSTGQSAFFQLMLFKSADSGSWTLGTYPVLVLALRTATQTPDWEVMAYFLGDSGGPSWPAGEIVPVSIAAGPNSLALNLTVGVAGFSVSINGSQYLHTTMHPSIEFDSMAIYHKTTDPVSTNLMCSSLVVSGTGLDHPASFWTSRVGATEIDT